MAYYSGLDIGMPEGVTNAALKNAGYEIQPYEPVMGGSNADDFGGGDYGPQLANKQGMVTIVKGGMGSGGQNFQVPVDSLKYLIMDESQIGALSPEEQAKIKSMFSSITANQNYSAGSNWTQFRDLAEGGVANFAAPYLTGGLSTLFNKEWSQGAQGNIDPGLQTVSAIAGIGGQLGEKYADPSTTPTGGTPTVPSGTPSASAMTPSMADPVMAGAEPLWGGGATTYDVGSGMSSGVNPSTPSFNPSLMSTLGQGVNLGTALYGLFGKGPGSDPGAADPYAQYRPQAAQQLQELQDDPSLVTKQPGYEAGLTAVERRMNSQGFQGSGNMMAELANYGTNAYDKAVQQLMIMSGASTSPSVGAQVNQQNDINNYMMRLEALNRLGSTLTYYGNNWGGK